MIFRREDKVKEVVVRFPKAIDIFQKYKIDYCCGGHRTLSEVSTDQDIEINQLLQDLDSYYSQIGNNKTDDWQNANYNDLVNHILQEHHAFLHTNLSIISDLAKTILRVHGANHPELLELFQTFQSLKTEFEIHLIKEETLQYPAIENYLKSKSKNDLSKAISVISELEKEHEVAGNLIKKINDLTNDYQTPKDGCETYHKTFNLLNELVKNTFMHIHLENNILFPRLMNE